MQISVIIPTYNRVKDIDESLDSVLAQTVLPMEIIIVDNSKDNKTENLLNVLKSKFEIRNISLIYIRNRKENSLTVARNIGVENSRGDIILFLDDDTVLDKDYIKEVLKIYEKYPDALGVQGFIKMKPFKAISFLGIVNLLSRFFYLSYSEKDKCRVLASLNSAGPYLLKKVISCQWLSGANHSFKRNVLEKFKYDEKLKKYSEGEDLDLSYRIFKKYPGSLYQTPYAKLIHKTSLTGRVLGKELAYMKEVYSIYLFYKIIPQNRKNKLIYLWSRIGKFIFNIGVSIFKSFRIGIAANKYLIEANIYCLKHIKEIKKGDLDFFNKTLK